MVAFKPREWRGSKGGSAQEDSAAALAKELTGHPAGTVSAIYVTSDGGAQMQDLYDLVEALDPSKVEVVDANQLADLVEQAEGG